MLVPKTKKPPSSSLKLCSHPSTPTW